MYSTAVFISGLARRNPLSSLSGYAANPSHLAHLAQLAQLPV
jgi:hypothetical protein